MIANRAKEIMNSEESIEVLYNGNQVWLENINTYNNMAYVKVIENEENILVPLDELRETGRELK